MNNSRFNLFPVAALLAAMTSACGAEPDDSSGPVSLSVETLEITDPLGETIAVELLPNSSVHANGDAHYVVSADERTLEVSRVVAPDGSEYLEALEDGVLLAALELQPESVSLRAANGGFLLSTTGELPTEHALTLVEPLALALMDQTNLDRFDALLREPGAPNELGVARQALRIRFDAAACAVTCSNLVEPKEETCCCDVGEKCVSLSKTCYCEDAHRLTRPSIGLETAIDIGTAATTSFSTLAK